MWRWPEWYNTEVSSITYEVQSFYFKISRDSLQAKDAESSEPRARVASSPFKTNLFDDEVKTHDSIGHSDKPLQYKDDNDCNPRFRILLCSSLRLSESLTSYITNYTTKPSFLVSLIASSTGKSPSTPTNLPSNSLEARFRSAFQRTPSPTRMSLE